MSTSQARSSRKVRRDGWTPERQLHFVDALALTRNVAKAAAAAGMSREGAYRLRDRSEGTLFALLWDRALALDPSPREVHTRPLTNGRIMRLLGTHYRRKRGDFLNIGGRKGGTPPADRTCI